MFDNFNVNLRKKNIFRNTVNRTHPQYSTSRTKNGTFTRNFKKTFFLDLEDGNVMVT